MNGNYFYRSRKWEGKSFTRACLFVCLWDLRRRAVSLWTGGQASFVFHISGGMREVTLKYFSQLPHMSRDHNRKELSPHGWNVLSSFFSAVLCARNMPQRLIKYATMTQKWIFGSSLRVSQLLLDKNSSYGIMLISCLGCRNLSLILH